MSIEQLCDEISISAAVGALMQYMMKVNSCNGEFTLDSPWGELKLECRLTVDGEEVNFKS